MSDRPIAINIFDPEVLEDIEVGFQLIGIVCGLRKGKSKDVKRDLLNIIATRIALDLNHYRLLLQEINYDPKDALAELMQDMEADND